MKKQFASMAGACALLAALAPQAGLAQAAEQNGQDEGTSSGGLGDIIVTAQRREQSLQKVPITVSVISADTLAGAGIVSTESLALSVPGLTLTRNVNGAVPFIRGIGTQDTTAGNESNVATYVDGVYYMAQNGNIFNFNNIERVEVLKGPQGTLFGRNATGGLINVTTKDPSGQEAMQGSISYGNYRTVETSLYVTGGNDDVAADLAFYRVKQNDGFGRNTTLNTDINAFDVLALRSKLLWNAGDDTKITFSGDYTEDKTDLGFSKNGLPGALLIGRATGDPDPQNTRGNFLGEVAKYKYWGASGRIEHQFDWASLTFTSAYRDFAFRWNFDQDGTPLRVADIVIPQFNRSFQNELLLVGDVGNLSYTAGLFSLHAKSGVDPLSVRSSLASSSNTNTFATQKLASYAAFVQGTYKLGPDTSLTAGIRYTVDKRDYRGRVEAATGNALPAGTTLLTRTDENTTSRPSWRLALDHQLSEEVLLYASYSRGFKSGLFPTLSLAAPVVLPETVDAYEVGFKSDLLDRTVRLNASAFHYRLKDLQVSRQITGGTQLFNAARARSQGFDVDLAFAPRISGMSLQLNAGLSYLDAKYTSFPAGLISTPNPAGGNFITGGNLAGLNVIRSPEWTLSLGLDMTIPMGGDDELRLSGSYFHSDDFAWDSDNRIRQAPYDVVNARASYQFSKQFGLFAFVKNLFDETYYNFANSSSLGDTGTAAPPRTYGVGISFDF